MVGVFFFFFYDPATTEIYTLSLHDALPIWLRERKKPRNEEEASRIAAARLATSRLVALAGIVRFLVIAVGFIDGVEGVVLDYVAG